MRNLILSTLSILALLVYPLSLSAQNSFSLSLDVDGWAGDQAVTSVNVSADQIVAIQIFCQDIRNANGLVVRGLVVRFEYDANLVVYESIDAGDVFPDSPFTSRRPGIVEISFSSYDDGATAQSGLVGTIRFRMKGTFSDTAIWLVNAYLAYGSGLVSPSARANIRIVLQGALTPPNFFLSLDVDDSAGDQAVTSIAVSTDEIVAIQIFGTNIRNANGVSIRFEYDESLVVYEGFEASDVLPNVQTLTEQSTNPGFVRISLVALGSQITANSGLLGTIRFRTKGTFSDTAIRLMRADLGRTAQIEKVAMDVRVELKLQVLTPDFNGDGRVDLSDFLLFASQFGLDHGDEQYDAKYDLDEDGTIGFGDFLIFGRSFGKETS